MKIPKPSDADKARFRSLVPEDPRIEVKPMFGNVGAFINGNMFMGLFGSDIGLKLPDDGLTKLRKLGGGPFGPTDRPMGGYVTLPGSLSKGKIKTWTGKALQHAAMLPPKQKKAKSA